MIDGKKCPPCQLYLGDAVPDIACEQHTENTMALATEIAKAVQKSENIALVTVGWFMDDAVSIQAHMPDVTTWAVKQLDFYFGRARLMVNDTEFISGGYSSDDDGDMIPRHLFDKDRDDG